MSNHTREGHMASPVSSPHNMNPPPDLPECTPYIYSQGEGDGEYQFTRMDIDPEQNKKRSRESSDTCEERSSHPASLSKANSSATKKEEDKQQIAILFWGQNGENIFAFISPHRPFEHAERSTNCHSRLYEHTQQWRQDCIIHERGTRDLFV